MTNARGEEVGVQPHRTARALAHLLAVARRDERRGHAEHVLLRLLLIYGLFVWLVVELH